MNRRATRSQTAGRSRPRSRPAEPRTARRRIRATDVTPWLIVLAALLVRLPGIGAGLPQVYEEAYPFKRAWDMWGFGLGGRIDLNPHFFRYPSLVFYAQFIGQAIVRAWLWLGGAVHSAVDLEAASIADPTAFMLAGRGIIALSGAATAWAAFALARAAGLGPGAWAAAAIVALDAPLVAQSRTIDVDVPLTLLTTLALVCAVRLCARQRTRDVVIAGVVAGLAASAKYTGVLALVPCMVALWIPADEARGERPGPQPPELRARLASIAIVVGSALAAFAVTSPYVLIDARAALADLSAERQHQELGHFGQRAAATWTWFLSAWVDRVAGMPLALASLAGFGAMLRRRRAAALIVGSFALAIATVLAGTHVHADRYLLPLVPVAAVLVGFLVEAITGLGLMARSTMRVRYAVITGSMILCMTPHMTVLAAQWNRGRTDSRTEAKQWIESHIPPGSMVVCEAYGPPLVGPLDVSEMDPELRNALARRGYGREMYAVLTVPSYQVVPRRSARFYQLALYRDADAFVVSDAVRSRYAAEPDSFAAQLAFYDSLPARFPVTHTIPASGGGPALTVYWHGRTNDRFADRAATGPDSAIVRTGTSIGGEDFFHYNQGANYEAFGRPRAAADAYEMCLNYPSSPDHIHTKASIRLAMLMVRAGRRDVAIRLLEDMEAHPKDPGEAEELGALRRRLAAGL